MLCVEKMGCTVDPVKTVKGVSTAPLDSVVDAITHFPIPTRAKYA